MNSENKTSSKHKNYYIGCGIGKTSRSIVIITPSATFDTSFIPSSFVPSVLTKSKCYVNGIEFNRYFSSLVSGVFGNIDDKIAYVLDTSSFKMNDFLIFSKLRGGGSCSQIKAFQYALASALLNMFLLKRTNDEYNMLKSLLRKKGLVSVDSRIKERKKAGQPKARRKRQFSKR